MTSKNTVSTRHDQKVNEKLLKRRETTTVSTQVNLEK